MPRPNEDELRLLGAMSAYAGLRLLEAIRYLPTDVRRYTDQLEDELAAAEGEWPPERPAEVLRLVPNPARTRGESA